MKKLLIITLILTSGILFAEMKDFSISGMNYAKYTRKSVDDSLKNYFEDDFTFNLKYDKLTFGMKFMADYPKYDSFSPVEDLKSRDLEYEWGERYLEYKGNDFGIRGGTLEEVFSTGLVFRSYEDEDLNEDYRLEGARASYRKDDFKLLAVYGINDQGENRNTAAGFDIDYIISDFRLGANFVNYQNEVLPDTYADQDVYSMRMNYSNDFFEFYGEYGHSNEYALTELNVIQSKARTGEAYNTSFSAFIKDVVITGEYLKYRRFDFKNGMQDVPQLYHSEEVLKEEEKPGEDEESVMGEIDFPLTDKMNIFLNYSEGWTSDYDYRISDTYTEIRYDFDESTFTFEFSRVEKQEKPNSKWSVEYKPEAAYDFILFDRSTTIKAANKYKKYNIFGTPYHSNEPSLQFDMSFEHFSLSTKSEYAFKNSEDLMDHELYPSIEISADIIENTELVFFAGKQKGGKICRRGVCRYEKEFSGVKLELTTRF